ncbi:MAG: hypothetical protein ABIO88_07510 [Burkholderiaceae bacterium]
MVVKKGKSKGEKKGEEKGEVKFALILKGFTQDPENTAFLLLHNPSLNLASTNPSTCHSTQPKKAF